MVNRSHNSINFTMFKFVSNSILRMRIFDAFALRLGTQWPRSMAALLRRLADIGAGIISWVEEYFTIYSQETGDADDENK